MGPALAWPWATFVREQNQTTASNVSVNSTREFITMSLQRLLIFGSFYSPFLLEHLHQSSWLAMQQRTRGLHLWVTGQVARNSGLHAEIARILRGISRVG